MKILTTYPGLEKFIQGNKLGPGIVESEVSSKVAKNEYILIEKITFTNIDELVKKTENINLKPYIKKSFTITCRRTNNDSFISQEIKQPIAKTISEKYNLLINHKNPETTIHLEIINNTCLLTISNQETKIKYKVRSARGSISSYLANAMLIQAEYTNTETLYDPFCKDGTIAIEAALSGSKKVHVSDSKPTNLYSAKVNATIAKITLKEGKPENIDKIITILPSPSKRTSANLAKRLISTIPKAEEYTFLIQEPKILEDFIKKEKKKITEKTKVLIGSQEVFIVTIK